MYPRKCLICMCADNIYTSMQLYVAINVKVYMRDGWFIPVPIKVGIIHVLGLLSTAMQEQVMELSYWAAKVFILYVQEIPMNL